MTEKHKPKYLKFTLMLILCIVYIIILLNYSQTLFLGGKCQPLAYTITFFFFPVVLVGTAMVIFLTCRCYLYEVKYGVKK